MNLNDYIRSLCSILQKEIDLIDTQNMTDQKRDYLKGRISVLEPVIDELYRLRQIVATWRPLIGSAYYEDEMGIKRVKFPVLTMWLHDFDTVIIGKEEEASS